MTRKRTRRAFLRAGFVSGTALIAGCSELGLGPADETSADNPEPTTPAAGGGAAADADSGEGPEQTGTDDDQPTSSASDAVWPMARYDPAGTGRNRDATGPSDRPGELWSAAVEGEPVTDPIATESTVFIGTSEQFLYAFSTDNGSLRWSTYLQDVPQTPALGDGWLFVPHAGVTAFDPRSGDELWTYDEDVTGALTPALYTGGWVYTGVTDSSGRTLVLALSSAGDKQWEQSTLSIGTSNARPRKLSSDGVRLYVGSSATGAAILNQQRGDRDGTLDVGSGPGIAVGREVFAYGGDTAGFVGKNDERRQAVLNDEVAGIDTTTAPLITDDFVVWGTTTGPNSDETGLMGMGLQRESLRWTEGLANRMPHAPVAGSERIYGTGEEFLYCVADSGADLWTARPGGTITSELAIHDERLYLTVARASGPKLIALGDA